MTIRYILRLRRQLAEARQENARLEGEVRSLEVEVHGLSVENADVRAANTELRQQAKAELDWRLDAVTVIDQHNDETARLLAKLKQAVDWATEVDRASACIEQRNRQLSADNERLRRELASLRQPVARVIPLQQRGPSAA